MITLTNTGSAIKFTFDGNSMYLQDGTIEVPFNSLTLVTDNSGMATFKKSATNDIFISASYDELGMTKSQLETWFKENACSTGGGGGNPTVELTQAEYDALVSAGTVSADTYYIITDATAPTITSAVTSASTDSQIPTAKAVYDAIQEGGGGGSITIDPSLDSGSTNAVANSAITEAFNGTTYGSPSTFNNSFVGSRTAYAIIYDVPNVAIPWYMRCFDSSVPTFTTIGIKDDDNFYDNDVIMTDIPDWIDQELSYYDSTTRKRYVFFKNGAYADYFSNVNGDTFTIFEKNNTGLISSLLSKHSIDTDAHTTAAEKTSWNGAVTALGGLKLQQITQADYDALVQAGTVDASTLYIITNVVS